MSILDQIEKINNKYEELKQTLYHYYFQPQIKLYKSISDSNIRYDLYNKLLRSKINKMHFIIDQLENAELNQL